MLKGLGQMSRLRALAVAWALVSSAACAEDFQLKDAGVQVYFSPNGGAERAVVEAIGAARGSILVQAYSFTSAPIAGALRAAHDRGVKVGVILDKSQETERYSGATFLKNAGIPVFIDSAHAIAHNKVMILSNEVVITGSFNFTAAAEKHNAENLLVIHDRGLAQYYSENWEHHLSHSGRY